MRLVDALDRVPVEIEGTEVELVVIRVVLPNGEVVEREAIEQLLRGARRQEEGVTR